jgi:signal transduction histidine kinase
MTANVPVTVKAAITAQTLPFVKLNFVAPQRRLVLFWLLYRWVSLLPAISALIVGADSSEAPLSARFLFVAAVGSSLLVTVLSRTFPSNSLELACFLLLDLVAAAALLAFSGNTHSPYYWYAFSPLLAGALLFQWRGALWAAAIFTSLYLPALALVSGLYPLSLELAQLVTQVVGIWLAPLLFGYPLALLQRLEHDQDDLILGRDDLTRQQAQSAAAHDQLEIIHDLTLRLQGAADIQSVQRRMLQVVTAELGFSQAMVGLVNSATHNLGDWQGYPTPPDGLLSAITPLPLAPEHGLMARVLLERRGCWWFNEEPLLTDEALNAWFSQSAWLILPLVLADQPVGLLLVAVEGGPGSLSEDQVVVLTAVASQAATALGTIDQTQRLAAEQERNRIARDIHDTVAQSLFGIVFTLDACIKLLPDQVETVQQELVELRHLADQVRHEFRRYILDAWPSELTQEGFKADLEKYVAHFSPTHTFHIDFTLNGAFDRLSPVIRRSLYRVSQEALANAARHAGVNSARLTMHVEPEEVYLSISDRGKGFDPKLALAREVNRERFGLRGMVERIQGLGGTCDILSQVGQGTQVLVRVPVAWRNERG